MSSLERFVKNVILSTNIVLETIILWSLEIELLLVGLGDIDSVPFLV